MGTVVADDLYKYTWSRIPHFFNSPYYVYQYATCFASSARLFNAMTTGSEPAMSACPSPRSPVPVNVICIRNPPFSVCDRFCAPAV